jgi:hypothetical protein
MAHAWANRLIITGCQINCFLFTIKYVDVANNQIRKEDIQTVAVQRIIGE